MHRKSLEISEKLGLLEGTASDYGNLGVVYETRGDLAKARDFWRRSVELYQRIGMPQMVQKVQGWIDELDQGGEPGPSTSSGQGPGCRAGGSVSGARWRGGWGGKHASASRSMAPTFCESRCPSGDGTWQVAASDSRTIPSACGLWACPRHLCRS